MAVRRTESGPFDRRFVFVTGKGGVGKTSVSAAVALSASQRGRKVLLATTDPSGYGPLLPGARWTHDPTLASPGLSVVHLSPDAALEEYGRLLIKPRLARRALFENRFVQGFLRAVPGLRAWAVLGKAWYHSSELVGDAPRFDSVVFDAPATGHGLEMLRVPRVIREVSPQSPLRRDAEAAWQLFQDRARCCIALVTLPEELPTNEAESFASSIATDLGLPLGCVVANRVCESTFDVREREALIDLGPTAAPLRAAVERAVREHVQDQCLARLTALGVPLYRLPDVPDVAPTVLIERLARSVARFGDDTASPESGHDGPT